jgi:biofilm PGA synthesis N-glycosyltransferase PgaC
MKISDGIFLISVVTLIFYSFFFLSSALVYFIGRRKKYDEKDTSVCFSIIIPARNEESNILTCLKSIIDQEYPVENYEIIVVDDDSEDNTVEIVDDFIRTNSNIKVRIISLVNNQYRKKGAISEGVKKAAHEIIITRDADTVSGKLWLNSIALQTKKYNRDFFIAPVKLSTERNFLGSFQQLEHSVLQSSGGGMALMGFPYLCNGANLIFKKSCFKDLNGYEGNFDIPSGDDIFLLEKFRKSKKYRIGYISSESAAVTTFGMKSWTDFFNQKSRWAGKFKLFTNPINSLSAFLVFFTNFLILLSAILSILESDYCLFFACILSAKVAVDLFILIFSYWKPTLRVCILIPLISLIIPIYIFLVLSFNVFNNFAWKGR